MGSRGKYNRRAIWAATGAVAVAVVLLISACAARPSSVPLGLVGAHTATSSATATPHPVVVVTQVQVSEAIPFAETTVDDPSLELGATAVTVVGQAGTTVKTYTVTTTDGRETSRVLASEAVTVAPVDQVTAIGSLAPEADPEPQPDVEAEQQAEQPQDPAPEAVEDPAPADSGGDCNPNYSGPCVPNASDVDCAGGSGNGPAYVDGPVYIGSSDPYDLDTDGDGVACEK